jgi:hypothetical protein
MGFLPGFSLCELLAIPSVLERTRLPASSAALLSLLLYLLPLRARLTTQVPGAQVLSRALQLGTPPSS